MVIKSQISCQRVPELIEGGDCGRSDQRILEMRGGRERELIRGVSFTMFISRLDEFAYVGSDL